MNTKPIELSKADYYKILKACVSLSVTDYIKERDEALEVVDRIGKELFGAENQKIIADFVL